MRRAIVLGGLAALASCGGGGAAAPTLDAPPPGLASVQILPASITLSIGQHLQLQLLATDNAGHPVTGSEVQYHIADPALATVDRQGMVTGVAPGTTTLTATVTWQGSSKAASTRVDVSAPPAPGAPNLVTTPGTSFQPANLTIQANDSVTWEFSGAIHNVTFTAAGPGAGNIPDQTPGNRATRTFGTAGTYLYECTRHAGMTGTVVVQGNQPAVFTALTVSPTSPAITVGGTVQLVVTAKDQFGTTMTGLPAPTFTTSASAVATVSAAGVVTGVAAGTATITASITSGGVTHSSAASVTVSVPTPASVTVTTPGNSFAPTTATIPPGGTVTWQFSGTHNVTFTGAAPAGGNIPDQGAGNAVSRTFATAGNFDYQCTRHSGMNGRVVVQGGSTGGSFASLGLTPTSLALSIGQTGQLLATPLDAGGAAISGLGTPTYTSSNASVASVSPTGLVTALAGGTATITASLTAAGTTKSATASVAVATGPVATITTPSNTFAPDDITVAPGTLVVWQITGATHNVTFKDTPPSGGNIGDTVDGGSAARIFTTVGTYDYACTIHKGMKGRVRVQ